MDMKLFVPRIALLYPRLENLGYRYPMQRGKTGYSCPARGGLDNSTYPVIS